jgi:hypothetical protein
MYDIEKSRKKEAMESKAKQLEKMSAGPMMDSSPYIYLPNFRLEKKDMPEIAKWDVGKTYELKVKVRMTGYEEHKSLNSEEGRANGEFDIIGIEPIEEKTLTE